MLRILSCERRVILLCPVWLILTVGTGVSFSVTVDIRSALRIIAAPAGDRKAETVVGASTREIGVRSKMGGWKIGSGGRGRGGGGEGERGKGIDYISSTFFTCMSRKKELAVKNLRGDPLTVSVSVCPYGRPVRSTRQ